MIPQHTSNFCTHCMFLYARGAGIKFQYEPQEVSETETEHVQTNLGNELGLFPKKGPLIRLN